MLGMIIGVNATSKTVDYARVSSSGSAAFQWDASACIESLPRQLHALCQEQPPLTGALIVLGPGGYTGLRVSLTALKMMQLVHRFPLKGVPLFDAYMATIFPMLNGIVLITSPSRKGTVNAQFFQTDGQSFSAISSLLQLSHQRLATTLDSFKAPIQWHWFDDLPIPNPTMIQQKKATLNVVDAIRHYEPTILAMPVDGQRLTPIYSCPPVGIK
jgi:tRNA A37 threonylcarbamoyladenosine modification protein TsaB